MSATSVAYDELLPKLVGSLQGQYTSTSLEEQIDVNDALFHPMLEVEIGPGQFVAIDWTIVGAPIQPLGAGQNDDNGATLVGTSFMKRNRDGSFTFAGGVPISVFTINTIAQGAITVGFLAPNFNPVTGRISIGVQGSVPGPTIQGPYRFTGRVTVTRALGL